nr:glycosyltransferase family 9 protein [uncultured Flavobacterium sp.]
MPKPKHILVIRLSAMGDVAMTVPVLRALVLQYPETKITVLSRPFFRPFFDGIANVSFYAVDLNKRHKGFVGLLRLYSDLRKLDIDTVADLHNVLRSKVIRNLFALSGKKIAATDKDRATKKALTRPENKIFAPVKSMVERHCDTFRELGFQIDLNHPAFPEKAMLTSEVIEIVGNKSGKWIGIAPFAQYESKVYPQDLMQQVIDALASDSNNKLMLFGGGEKEITVLNQMKQNRENVVVVAGKLKLEQELNLISNLDIMLSMDSGNAHIAAMLGVKVITLWGATHPYAGFSPFNQPLENAITSDRGKYPKLPTSVYGNKMVEGYEDAMRTILPEMVINKIKKEL